MAHPQGYSGVRRGNKKKEKKEPGWGGQSQSIDVAAIRQHQSFLLRSPPH